MITLSTLQVLLDTLEQDDSLHQPEQLRRRIEAIDRIETYFNYGPSPDDVGESPSQAILHRRARTLCADLEAANFTFYQSIRDKIRHGSGADALHPWMTISNEAVRPLDQLNGVGYDYLDVLISGVLQFEQPRDDIAELAPDMVFYQPTPARDIFDLIGRTALNDNDVLFDLGAGLGHVSLLSAICTGARCIGIELEGAYVDCARQAAQSLNVHNATFIQQDVRATDFSSGTVFYLYTPFSGTILRDVLNRLKQESDHREIRICTLGPCTSVIGKEPWLTSAKAFDIDRVATFRSI